MFHMVGVTPEARTEAEAFGGREPARHLRFTADQIEHLYREFVPESDHPDLVVFTAPQLSIMEISELAQMFEGKTLQTDTRALITTSSIAAAEARRLGYIQTLETTGVIILEGVCFYVMAPHELAERFGYRTLVTDSAKLANIIPGYGYNPVFRPTSVCVEAATTGEIPW